MGAVEHLKTLCCLGLPPESAMIAVTPLLHKIIPHGWSRIALLAPDATINSVYAENPALDAVLRQRLWQYMNDPEAPISLWVPAFRAVSIGWSLHKQDRKYLESDYYREIEAPLDSCWLLTAMIGDAAGSFATVQLTRPRIAKRFTVDDVSRLDRLRPWLSHALRPCGLREAHRDFENPIRAAGPPVASGDLILTAEGELVYETAGVTFLLRILTGEKSNFTQRVTASGTLAAPVLSLVRRIVGAANGSFVQPPRMQLATAYGILTLEAKWLIPEGITPMEVAEDPKDCLIAVTIELRQNAIAHAATVLRERGATPAEIRVGVQLALGEARPVIADRLGIQISTVADLTKKLYQKLEIHNSSELSARLWLNEMPVE